MAPNTTKAQADLVTLTKGDAAVIRAAFLTIEGWKPEFTKIGEAIGLGSPRNGGRVFRGGIAKIGLDFKNGKFVELSEDGDAAVSKKSQTANGKKPKSDGAGKGGKVVQKKARVEAEETVAGAAAVDEGHEDDEGEDESEELTDVETTDE